MDRFDHFFIRPGDFDASVAFYRDALGWREVSSWGDDATGRGIVLRGGEVSVVIAERHDDVVDSAQDAAVNGTRPTLHIAVDDVRERFARIGVAGHVSVPPEKTHWGVEWFVLRDPDGNLVAFTSAQK